MNPFLINEPSLQVLPSLAKAIGLNEALILQQIHYWLNPKHNQNHFEGRYWVYNTYEQWQEQFPFWCPRTIRSCMNKLEEAGLIVTFVKQDACRKVKHYSINYTVLHQLQGISHMHPAVSKEEEEDAEEEADEEESIQEMLLVWNDTVQSQLLSCQPVTLTPKRLLGLTNLRDAFAKQGLSWGNYCNKIAETRFLMGNNTNGFKATIDWALNLDNAYKVLEGAIYDKPSDDGAISQEQSWNTFMSTLESECSNKPNQEVWLQVSLHLAKKLGQQIYKSWFLETSLNIDETNTAVLEVGSAFKRDYLKNNFLTPITHAIKRVCPEVQEVKFVVSKTGGSDV